MTLTTERVLEILSDQKIRPPFYHIQALREVRSAGVEVKSLALYRLMKESDFRIEHDHLGLYYAEEATA